MKQRVGYIDSIKGFAILLVVMGHVIANWFNDFYTVHDDDPDNQLLVWRLIYSFHMPLFMFCSGLFQPIMDENSTMCYFWNVLVKRFKVLIIPYFASGLLLWGVTGRPSFYWFLLVLFEFIIINLVISFIASKFNQKANFIEVALFTLTFLVTHVISSRFVQYEKLPFLDFGHLSLYFYFTVGYLVAKYKLLGSILNNETYSIAIIVFSFLFIYSHVLKIDVKIPLSNTIVSSCGIYVVFYLFREKLDNRYVVYLFSYLGRHSLELYIIHFFFLTKLPFIGDFIHQQLLFFGGVFS